MLSIKLDTVAKYRRKDLRIIRNLYCDQTAELRME